MERIAVFRHVLLLTLLSVGLCGCQTCRKITSRLPFLGKRGPEVVTTEPPIFEPITTPAVAAVPQPIPGPVVTTEQGAPRPRTEPKIEESLQTVNFDYDSAALTDVARRILQENLKWLKDHPEVQIQLEGHCDERGTEEYNYHLGERRANSVKEYLVQNEIKPDRLFSISFGKKRPIDPGHDESAWWKNRRVQFSRY